MTAAETWEDKIRNNEQENVDSLTLGGTEMAASMAPSPSPAEERITKKRPAQSIGRRISEVATVS